MEKLRSFSTAERAVMDSRWEFEHAGGRFEVGCRLDYASVTPRLNLDYTLTTP